MASRLKQLHSIITFQNGVLLVAIMIVGGSLWTTISTLQRNFLLQRQLDELSRRVELEDIEAQNLALEGQYYRSREYLEVSARDKLGKAAPGETMIILPQQSSAQQASAVSGDGIESSNFQQWMRFLFGSQSRG